MFDREELNTKMPRDVAAVNGLVVGLGHDERLVAAPGQLPDASGLRQSQVGRLGAERD